MRIRISAALAAASLAVAGVGQAHHSGSIYDNKHPITLRGFLVDIDWVNPHCLMHFMVKLPEGNQGEWTVESGPPEGLRTDGLTKRRMEAAMGTMFTVYISPAKDGTKLGFLNGLDFPDGTKVRVGAPPPANGSK